VSVGERYQSNAKLQKFKIKQQKREQSIANLKSSAVKEKEALSAKNS